MVSTIKSRIHAVRTRAGVYAYSVTDAVLAAVFSLARMFDNSLFRRARFDSASRGHEFLFTDRGQERFIVIASDQMLSRPVYVYGNYEFGKFEKVIALLEGTGGRFKLDTVIDVGANIGTICIAAVKRGYAVRAIAIEPEPKNYRALVANIYLNDLADKIVPLNLALGEKHGQTLTLELSPDNSGDHRIRVSSERGAGAEEKRETVVVKSDSFDSSIEEVDRNSYLIWMDTQGYEGVILQGAQSALMKKVPMVIEFWPYGMQRANSYAALRTAIGAYSQFYDLSDPEPIPVAVSDSALDDLYQRLERRGGSGFTDILVV